MNIIIIPHYADAWAGLLDPVLNCPEVELDLPLTNLSESRAVGVESEDLEAGNEEEIPFAF